MISKQEEKPLTSPEDLIEIKLKKIGCLEKHYKVQECIATTKDWRKCQSEVNEFRICIAKHRQEEEANMKSEIYVQKRWHHV